MSTQIKSMHSPPDDKEANHQNAGHPPAHIDPNAHLISQVMQPEFQKLGNPGPLGLYSFAITSFMLGLYNCGAGMPGSEPGATNAVLGTAIFMGGIAQFAAGMWEMRVGNTFGATLHSSYGAFWLAYSCVLIPGLGVETAYEGDEHAYSYHMGIFLIGWCWLTFLFALAALRTNAAVMYTLITLVLAFLFLALGEFMHTHNSEQAVRLTKTGGAFTVLTAMGAFYTGSHGLFLPATTYFTVGVGKFK